MEKQKKYFGGKIMSDYQKQKTVKPDVEDVIHALLKDEKKQAALDFVAFVKSMRMKPQWASTNSWTFSYKSKRVGYIKINESGGDWELWSYAQYDKYFQELAVKENSDIQNYIINNVLYCYKCSACAPGKNMVLLGKELKNICATPVFRVKNPNGAFCDFAKRLINLRREAIESERVPKVTYIAMKNRK
jgi:hypothetical protein